MTLNRYDASGLAEGQFELGSNDLVLRNLRGITDPAEMDRVEAAELAASQVERLMAGFEEAVLNRNTPCRFDDLNDVVRALAEVHVELVLIHPFRDGNGRIARVLAILMALQAGLPVLQFRSMTGGRREDYFAAVQAGINGDFLPMKRAFARVVSETLARGR